MIVYLLLGFTVLLGIAGVVLVYQASRFSLRTSWHALTLAVSICSFVYLYGTWVYLSIYAKYLYGALVLLSLIAGAMSRRRNKMRIARWKAIPNLLFALLFATLSVLYFTGTEGKPAKIALAFPLRTGTYFILQGGKGLPTNFFHYSYRGAIFAIDIVKLNRFGNRAQRIFSPRLQDYGIYNDTVFSPCDGLILRARDENPDNIPPSRERGPSNTNQLLIQNDSCYVFMGHLRYKGVFVTEGSYVKKGQPLALVGNSGFSLEPHLHIQAHRNTGKAEWYREEPLHIEFDGRSYLMFEVIRPKRVDMVEH